MVCVDDEPHVLAAMRRMLADEPCEVVVTDDVDEALRTIDERDVSVLVADHRMPGMRGTELLRRVRLQSPRTARVMVTAYPDADVMSQRMGEAVQHLVTKPWDNDRLRGTIADLIRRREQDPEPTEAVRVNCRELSTPDALRSIAEALCRLAPQDVLLELEGVERLRGPVSRFFWTLFRMLSRLGHRVVIIDPSGLAAVFGAAIGADLRVLRRHPGSQDHSEKPPSPARPIPDGSEAGTTDADLMNRAIEGDRDAYGELFKRFSSSIWRVAYLLLHSAAAADDAVQEVFLRGLDRITTYRREAPVRSWFWAIALNLCRHQLRNESGHAHAVDPAFLDAASPSSPGVLGTLLDRERALRLADALLDLDPLQREIFIQHYVDGLPYERIAERFGTTAGAARVQAHRARGQLRDQLGVPPSAADE